MTDDERSGDALPEMAWDAWGDPSHAAPLPDGLRDLLGQAFRLPGAPPQPIDIDDVRVRDSALSATDRAALTTLVGADAVSTTAYARLRHAGGRSTTDLFRRMATEQDAPDAVVEPSSHDDTLAVLEHCSKRRIAVLTYGGGTGVVGGLEPDGDGCAATVSLDMRRLDSISAVDPISQTATLGAGLTGPRAEALLGAQGFRLGHYPQSFEYATIGGFAATRSSGQSSSGYGRFDEMVQALTVATPRGTVRLGRAPASAAGPDLRQLFLGSEGVLGVITDVTVRIHPTPTHTAYAAWAFPDFATGTDALRTLVQRGVRPTVLRLSDEAETAVNHATQPGSSPTATGCLAIATFDGATETAEPEREAACAVLADAGATWCGEEPAAEWESSRFAAPYSRDALLRVGAIVETLETATSWSNLGALRSFVIDALTTTLTDLGTPPLVLCHVSHTYRTGASLYFTVVCAQDSDPIEQWSAAKRAASIAIVESGGTVSHHHAVGREHRPWMADEIGSLGVDVLRAVKNTVDPAGILNPGKLIPDSD